VTPLISSISPAKGAVNVSPSTTIKITFNESIKAGDMNIQLTSNGTSIPFTATISGNILTIKTKSVMAKGTKYTLTLHTDCVTDLAGNPLALTGSTFTTV